MLNHTAIAAKIEEKDRPLLGYLTNISLEQHSNGFGFDLIFNFEKNSYFKDDVLKKTFVMCKENVIEKCIGTPISWNAGCDITKTKKKKGKGKKKVTVEVKAISFFNFFDTVETEKKKEDVSEKKEEDEDEEQAKEDHDAEAEQMEQDFDLGVTLRDGLIPHALEYYLGVIEEDSDVSEGDYGDEEAGEVVVDDDDD